MRLIVIFLIFLIVNIHSVSALTHKKWSWVRVGSNVNLSPYTENAQDLGWTGKQNWACADLNAN